MGLEAGAADRCVTKCEEGPLLSGLYAPANREVSREHARMAKDVLRPLGVICFTRVDPVEQVRLLTLGRFDDDEFEGFELIRYLGCFSPVAQIGLQCRFRGLGAAFNFATLSQASGLGSNLFLHSHRHSHTLTACPQTT